MWEFRENNGGPGKQRHPVSRQEDKISKEHHTASKTHNSRSTGFFEVNAEPLGVLVLPLQDSQCPARSPRIRRSLCRSRSPMKNKRQNERAVALERSLLFFFFLSKIDKLRWT